MVGRREARYARGSTFRPTIVINVFLPQGAGSSPEELLPTPTIVSVGLLLGTRNFSSGCVFILFKI